MCISPRRRPDAMPIQVQAGQFAFYFRYPGPDGKFGPLHPELINEGPRISLVSTPTMMRIPETTS